MKKLIYILCFATALTGCENAEDLLEWDRVTALIEKNGDYDPAVVPSMLTTNVLGSAMYFRIEDKGLINGGSLPWPGSQRLFGIFFEDGTCRECWTDIAMMHDGGPFYQTYNWKFDPQTRTLITWNEYIEAHAAVKAVVGDDTLILEGDLWGWDGLRIVLQIDPDMSRRARDMERYRNIADYE